MAASSSSSNYYSSRPPSRCTSYDVFLSFSSTDTRLGFTDFLYHALVDAGINTFRGNDDLERGEATDPELYKAIHDLRCSIIVLSKKYASSESCLFQLVTILDRKRTSDHIILPVFYHVDPDTMLGEKGCYKEAFDGHRERFKDETSKVNRWREALEEASKLAEMNLENQADRHEARFIKKIVNVVEDKLRRTPLSVTPYLIGIDYQLEEIKSWIDQGSKDVGILFISGISGIGKTTIAKSIYNSYFNRFEGSAFLENISSEISGHADGVIHLQRKLLSILTGREVTIYNVDEGTNKIKDTIFSKRVILVLDDVDKFEILEALIGMREWFCLGSKIIITTRQHTQLLKAREVYKVHEVKQLNECDSLKLFCWHAFGQDHPKDEHYKQLSSLIVDHCGGLPLALQTLGRSSISWKTTDNWKSAIEKLDDIPNGDILGKLKLSYDALHDEHDRNLFLDITCFFIGEDTDFIVAILNECGFHSKIGIQNLIDRYLITIDDKNNQVKMHNLLRDMGREIIRQESPKEPSKRSRLWKSKDSFNVLNEKTGEKSVEGVVLGRWSIPFINPNDPLVCLEANAFAKMDQMRLLILHYVQLNRSYETFAKRLTSFISSRGYEAFPKGLRWLSWHGFPLDSIPSDFVFQSLVALDMSYSNLKRVWKLPKPLPLLKILNLSHSDHLTETPDFSLLPKLERFVVCDCVNLVVVHETICRLEFLKTLDISGCSNLSKFPLSEIWKMKSLKVFRANDTTISRWLHMLGDAKPLAILWPRFLVEVGLKNCNLSNDDFPRDLNNLSSLQSLDLGRNQISVLPDCIRNLNIELNHLSFWACENLQTVIGLPRVKHLNVTFCMKLEKVTFQSASCKPQSMGAPEFRNLIEFEYWFKVEPIGSIDVKMINILGLSNLDSMEDINIIITSTAWGYYKRLPIQGIYEHGLFNIFLPWNEIPGCCQHNWRTSVSFTLPRIQSKIQGLNLSIIYAVPDGILRDRGMYAQMMIEVKNNSTRLKWIYLPSFFGYLDDAKDMIWLSHWKLGNQLEGGDKMTVSIFLDHLSIDLIEVKDLGVQVVYDQEETISTKEYIENSNVGGFYDFLPNNHEVMRGTYFMTGLLLTRELRVSIWRHWEINMSDQRKRMEEFDHFDHNLERAIEALPAASDDDH